MTGRHRTSHALAMRSGALGDPVPRLLKTARVLMSSTMASALLGFGFWVFSARLCSRATLGEDAALITLLLGVGSVTDLNLNASLPKLLPQTRRKRRLVGVSYAITGPIGILAGLVIVLVAVMYPGPLGFLARDRMLLVILPIATAMWTWFSLQDSVLAAIGRARLVLVVNVTYGIAKIVTLLLLARTGVEHAVYLAWVLPAVVATLAVAVYLFFHALSDRLPPNGPAGGGRTSARRFLAADYAALLLHEAAPIWLQFYVVQIAGGRGNAALSVPLNMVLIVDSLYVGVAVSLTVEGASAPGSVNTITRSAVRRLGPLLLLAVGAGVAVAPIVLWPFGGAYAAHGTGILRILLLACIPQAVIALQSVLWRLDGLTHRTCALQAVFLAVLVVSAVFLVPMRGPYGGATAWLLAQALPAALILPALYRRLVNRGRYATDIGVHP